MNRSIITCAIATAIVAVMVFSGCAKDKVPASSPSGAAAGDKAGSQGGGAQTKGAPGEAVKAEDLKPQETCPVMGGKINKDVYADYNGQRVYFCCPGCEDTFKKNPEMYLAKLKSQGQKPEKLQ